MQRAARLAQSSWKNKPFFVTELRMAVRFSKPVKQLWLKSIKRFQPVLMLVPLRQLRTKPPALPKDGGKGAPSAPPKKKKAQKDSPSPESSRNSDISQAQGRKVEKTGCPLGKHSIVFRLWP
ncbi:hypothetical protein PoB_001438200 [Plakobranchus ocellatus]|uniref:Uncharacterized protein n=1 Tax=Plakobranchus ocellatus TaxID=259542 RepID=A0AAV3Z079_9GAST|nr:hypothetical protein PoB_001438200 [Plakobranchus ocellatus]